MGIIDKIKSEALNQFIEVIEWLDDDKDTILYRFPVAGQEIKNGCATHRKGNRSQRFLFMKDRLEMFLVRVRFTIDGGNTPILSKLGAWKHGF